MEKGQYSSIFKRLREKVRLSQAEMAEAMSISLRFYQALEGGEKDPSFETILKVREGLKIPIYEIVGEKPPAGPAIPNDQMEVIKTTIEKGMRDLYPRLSPLVALASRMTDKQLQALTDYAHTIIDRKSPEEIAQSLRKVSSKKTAR